MAKDDQVTNELSPSEVTDRIWELAKKIDFCMFTTWDGEHQQARPLSARVDRDEHAIYFLVDVDGEKNAEIAQYPTVSVTFSDIGAMKYVAISGQASISNDRAKIKELWNDFDKAWWDDENDPSIRLLTVIPEQGELWDSPGKAVAYTQMLVAAVTGGKPKMGNNAEVNL
ncbi:MAG: ral stress protein [Devosia sp.]|nr:ral stress protein [Devosia sp.]